MALVGLEDREGHVGGTVHASELGPGDEVGQPVGVVDHGHVRVVVGCQPLEPVRGDGAEAVGVGRVAGDGEGRLAAPFWLGAPRAHRLVPSVYDAVVAATSPVKCPQGRPIVQNRRVFPSSRGFLLLCPPNRPVTGRWCSDRPADSRPIAFRDRPISPPGPADRVVRIGSGAGQLVGGRRPGPGHGEVLEVDQAGQVDLQLAVAEAGGVPQLRRVKLGSPWSATKLPRASRSLRVAGDISSAVVPSTQAHSRSTAATSASVASM